MRCALTRKALALSAIAALLLPASLSAQAWLPEKGSVATSILYSDIFDTKHFLPDGEELDVGHTRTHSIGLSVSYSPTDRIMLNAGLPYVTSEYHGDHPHPTVVDDSRYHGTFTDLRIELHYQARLEPFAFAPYVALVEPTHDYETLGHAAPGRGLREEWIGFFVGKNLDLWIPRTYVQARYAYAFVEPVAHVGHDRSNLDVEVAYFVRPAWSVRGLLFWQHTHGGIEVPIPPTDPLFPFHDRLAAENFFNVGAGTSYALSDRMSLYALYTEALWGENGHKLGRGINLGFGYAFGDH